MSCDSRINLTPEPNALYGLTETSRTGSALLTVLWLTAALSAIALAVAANVRGETERAATNLDDTKATSPRGAPSSRAAAAHAMGRRVLQIPFPGDGSRLSHGRSSRRNHPGRLQTEPQRDAPEELQRLLLALGQPEDRADEIAAAIVDWRTPVTPLHQSLFDAFYLAQSPSFLPAHASFTQNEDLLLVKGITPDLYYGTSLDGSRAGLRDCLSVYGSSSVDINHRRAKRLSPPESRPKTRPPS